MFPSSASGFQTQRSHLTVLGVRSPPERRWRQGSTAGADPNAPCVEMFSTPLVFIISLPIKQTESIND